MAVQISYSALEALVVTNLHSLADGSYWQSAARDNAADGWHDVLVEVEVQTNTSAGDAYGYCSVFISASLDGTEYAGRASGGQGAFSPSPNADSQAPNMVLLGRVAARANETTARTYSAVFSVAKFFSGFLPRYYKVVIENQTGQLLSSSGNEVNLQGLTYTDT